MFFEFAEDLVISSEAHVTSFPDSIDYFLSRFLPFPLDLRSLVYGFKVEGGTPFLETQANVPLGMLWLWLVYSFVQLKKQQPFQWGQSLSIILSILLFSMITWMSLSTKPYQFLPDYFQNIQFTYRIVFYQNLAIIFAVYSLFQAWPKNPKDTHKKNFSKTLQVVVAICLSFAFLACLEKNLHGFAIVGYSKPEIPRTLQESILLNHQNYGAYSYNVMDIPQVKMDNYTEANFEVQVSPGFGNEVLPLKLNLSETQWIQTNIHAFTWNQILVNGSPLKRELLKMVPGKTDTGILTMNTYHLAFQLPSGKYTLHYQFKPEPIYLVLRKVSLLILKIWIIVTVLIEGVLFFSKYRIFNLQK